MSVDAIHSAYEETLDDWVTCRDAAIGQKAVHAAGDCYLPILDGQERKDYLNYIKRATYTGFTGRTISSFTGMIFRKPPKLEVPDNFEELSEDITATGITLESFAESIVREDITTGRVGVLVDFQRAPSENITQAQANALGLRPFWRLYKAEDITNWRTEYLPGKGITKTLVVLKETFEDSSDPFLTKEEPQYRALRLSAGIYTQEVWRKTEKDADWMLVETITPLMNGKPLDYIPFVFISPNGTSSDVSKPPVFDLAIVNIDHYRTMADYKHGLHYVGLPTPWIAGVTPEDSPKSIGPSAIWAFSDANAKAEYLQVDAEGFGTLREELSRLVGDMAALGARLLAPDQKKVAESGDALEQRAAGESSVLASLAYSVSRALTTALKITADWLGADSKNVSISLNTDFVTQVMDANLLAQLIKAVQSGILSMETFYDTLVRGEVVASDHSYEEERDRIDGEGAGLPDGFNAPTHSRLTASG